MKTRMKKRLYLKTYERLVVMLVVGSAKDNVFALTDLDLHQPFYPMAAFLAGKNRS